ncbi:HAD-IIB family hydrolase [Aeoliella mucimassa]|uniref:sucrose-phosphate synthase n=1 Tax=Aeoliella mucimassa TaxID=2527972 RepID=A0A518AII9_9BACT|nr:HAD-IIB family hydrolase [Aeoliella mucimassa]QDU54520.1 Mannosylfructose-phosphate synthase [Aeoliella mucimassa]
MYLQLISIHGLIRGESVEMGRDADTGGQVRYVLELAKTLSKFPQVEQVDLFTRRIKDRRVSEDYAEEIEQLTPNCRIVRLPCGGGKYIRKERLWPHLDEYVDAMISFTRREGREPALVHGHYADAGYVAKEVASMFGAPFVFTGHSLGKPKLDYLESEGWTIEQANKELAIEQRINVEQDCLAVADLVITSTRHERDHQYRDYFRDGDLRFEVIPPGTDLERFFPYYEYDMPSAEIDERFKQARVRMNHDLGRFHLASDKPLILALCRPDRRKNIGALIDAYGQSNELKAIANLAVFAGIRQDIETMPDNEQQVLTDMLLAMDRYDLYGKMAIPKNHDSEYEVPELYRLAAASRGIFVNTAFTELFGLTAIESSATGLPFVVTENGGPQDIEENCKSGLLVDVNDQQQLTSSMIKLLTDNMAWTEASTNGVNRVREFYTWESHCERYLEVIDELVDVAKPPPTVRSPLGRRIATLDCMLITDIDNTLLGDDAALESLKEIIHENRDRMGFGVASGRALELVNQALEDNGIEEIDVVIASVGCEIYYGRDRVPDKGWASQLRARWRPDRIHEALDPLSFLTLQTAEHTQREFKVSYDLDAEADADDALALIHEHLARAKVGYTLVFSHGTFIDLLPHRASKGKAVRYLSGKWNVPLNRVATAGDSGNDRDMLMGQTAGIVVGNYDEELSTLKNSKTNKVYFANAHCAAGIIEGLQHYRLIEAPVTM